MIQTLLTLEIRYEEDVVLTRQRARQVAELIGFDAQDQIRIATAVSEIARNAFQYGNGGRVEFRVDLSTPQNFCIDIRDKGRGINNLKDILAGRYTSNSSVGLGIDGARRLVDRFEIDSANESGTTVSLVKYLPSPAQITLSQLATITDELVKRSPRTQYEEIQQQNQELLQALEALRRREEQLSQLNHELEDTNRGVVALYAELDEKADSLRRANELKTRFLSNMSHEFRTPLNSVISLTRMLLERVDGELTVEQDKQVRFIRKAAEDLSELVNDLLDLAKVEAGKVTVRPVQFEVSDLFATLRGMLRPLLTHNSSINLIFEESQHIPTLHTDEGKFAQILRNFISNALKYTEQGEVRITATRIGDHITIAVADTGIGITPEDQERIFEDFVQIESHLQRQVRGTGLGLPLARKLAELLGGNISVSSTPKVGSTFSVTIPLVHPSVFDTLPASQLDLLRDPKRSPLLVIEDNPETIFTYEKYAEGSIYQIMSARTLEQARQVLTQIKPVAIIMDILLENQNTWSLLTQLKEDPDTCDIPILVITVIDNEKQAKARGAEAFLLKPVDRLRLLNQLNILAKRSQQQTLLVIDDDPVARYLIKQQLSHPNLHILEASNGKEGMALVDSAQPQAIILDLSMPEMDGVEVLKQLQQYQESLPVIINTSQSLSPLEQEQLKPYTIAILSKQTTSSAQSKFKLQEALVKAGLIVNLGGTEYV